MAVMLCPKCRGGTLMFGASGAECQKCGNAIAYRGRVLDLVGGEQETKLDVAAYDRMVGDPLQNAKLFQPLVDVLAKIGKTEIPVTVEFGAGTGAWTVGMDQSPDFRELYATDISFRFQEMLGTRVTDPQTHLVCQSAERLNFQDGSVDLVVGRSFLHHILDYEELLAKCGHWLKPDGVAVFFEPCMQGKIWVAFFAEAIRRLDANLPGEKSVSDEQSKTLIRTMRHILKEHYNKNVHELRPMAEDKWIFDLDALRETARRVGFSKVLAIDEGGPDRLMPAVKTALIGALKDNAAVKRYHALFESFTATVVPGLPQILTSPMVFFVFAM